MHHLPGDHDIGELYGKEKQHKQNGKTKDEFQQSRPIFAFQKLEFESDSGNTRLACRVNLPRTAPGSFRQTTRRDGNGGVEYRAEFRLPEKAEVNELVLSAVRLPANSFGGREIFVDGKKITFPRIRSGNRKQAALFRGEVRRLEFPLNEGVLVISGKFRFISDHTSEI